MNGVKHSLWGRHKSLHRHLAHKDLSFWRTPIPGGYNLIAGACSKCGAPVASSPRGFPASRWVSTSFHPCLFLPPAVAILKLSLFLFRFSITVIVLCILTCFRNCAAFLTKLTESLVECAVSASYPSYFGLKSQPEDTQFFMCVSWVSISKYLGIISNHLRSEILRAVGYEEFQPPGFEPDCTALYPRRRDYSVHCFFLSVQWSLCVNWLKSHFSLKFICVED